MCLKKDHWDRSKDPSLAFSRQDMGVEDKAMCSEWSPLFSASPQIPTLLQEES